MGSQSLKLRDELGFVEVTVLPECFAGVVPVVVPEVGVTLGRGAVLVAKEVGELVEADLLRLDQPTRVGVPQIVRAGTAQTGSLDREIPMATAEILIVQRGALPAREQQRVVAGAVAPMLGPAGDRRVRIDPRLEFRGELVGDGDPRRLRPLG